MLIPIKNRKTVYGIAVFRAIPEARMPRVSNIARTGIVSGKDMPFTTEDMGAGCVIVGKIAIAQSVRDLFHVALLNQIAAQRFR